MSASKYTPGPWVVGPADDTVVTHLGADGQRYTVAEIDGDYNQPETWPVMEANARLIAAAPDLYEALVAAKQHMWIDASSHWTKADFSNWATIQQINAALEKADGKSRPGPIAKAEGPT